jgi:nucleoside-diphosphate-sugar epimerase
MPPEVVKEFGGIAAKGRRIRKKGRKGMRVLVTGGGSALARAFAETHREKFEIVLADWKPFPAMPGIESIVGDWGDPDFVAHVVQGKDAVVHLDALQAAERSPTNALDTVSRGTYVLATEAKKAGVPRFVLGSSLALFDRLPPQWNITESWQPRPGTELDALCPFVAELSLRETARQGAMRPICLRFGQIVSDSEIGAQPPDSRWLHIEDAVQALHHALTCDLEAWQPRHAQWIFHITAGGEGAKIRLGHAAHAPLNYAPKHVFMPTRESGAWQDDARSWQEIVAPVGVKSRPIHNVVVFGAGGPLGAIVAQELQNSYRLRLTDLRALEDIAREGKPQSEGAPIAKPLPAPHENRMVDVSDYEQVLAACEGMDAIVNASVLRDRLIPAFGVNTVGAYHMAQAAIHHGIRRIVQTGPAQNLLDGVDCYSWDYDVPEALPRPAAELYFHTKFLGQEIQRIYAEVHGLEIPCLLFQQFANPTVKFGLTSFSVSWEDSALAVRRALEVPTLPRPFEVLNILCDQPHGKYSNQRAKEVLQWQPRDNMEAHWQR